MKYAHSTITHSSLKNSKLTIERSVYLPPLIAFDEKISNKIQFRFYTKASTLNRGFSKELASNIDFSPDQDRTYTKTM
jgi:hypothetical protein